MHDSERRTLGRWTGLAIALILLVLFFSLLGSLSAAAGREPVPPPSTAPQTANTGATLVPDGPRPERLPEPGDRPPLGPPYQSLTSGGPWALGSGATSLDAARLAPPLAGSASLAICLTTERVWGLVGAGETATVTVGSSQTGAALADANGFFWTTLYDSAGYRPGLDTGDTVAVYHDGTLAASLTLRSISANVDVVGNTVQGTIGGLDLPITVVVYAGQGNQEPSRTAYSRTVTTDGSGEFAVDFGGEWDLAADDPVTVAYLEDGVEVHQRFHGPRLFVLPFPFAAVGGWTTPGALVTGTVFSDLVGPVIRDQRTLTARADGRYDFSDLDSLEFEEGDVVVVEIEGGQVLTRSVDHITTPEVDTASDRVVGEVEPGAVVHGRASSLTPLGYRDVYATDTADGSGAYTLEFGALADLMPGSWGGGYVEDDEGDALGLWAPSPSVEVHQTWDEVRGRAPAPPGPLSFGIPVTLTVNSDGSESVFVQELGWYGDYYFSPEDGLPDIGPGDVISVEREGSAWQGVVQVQAMSGAHDPELDQIAGSFETPSERVELSGAQWWHWSYGAPLYPAGGYFDTLNSTGSPFAVTLEGFDLRNGVEYDVGHRTGDDYLEMIYNAVDHVRVWPWYGAVGAHLGPAGTPYTFTLSSGDGTIKGQHTGTSGEPTGWTDYWWLWQEGIEAVPGDRVQVESAVGFSQTVSLPDLSLNMEEGEDILSGIAPANSLLLVQVQDQGAGFVPVGADGNYAVSVGQLQDLWGDGDLRWGNNGMMCYLDEHSNQVCRGYDWPHISANVGPNSDGNRHVWGYGAEANATVLVSVTTSGGAFVASTAAESDGLGNYDTGGDLPEGTLANWNDITVDFANEMTDTLTVYPMGGEANPDTDVITVTAAGESFFSISLEYCSEDWCDWIDMGSIGESGTVTVNLAAERGFDVQPGTHYDASLSTWHNHELRYSWLLPIADLWLEKETSPGHAIPGGPYLYQIRYGNNGTGTTEGTFITDTLPANTAYQADTSGFSMVTDGSVITWTLDPVPPGSEHEFFVALSVDAGVPVESNLDANCASISAEAPPEADPGNNRRCSGEVWVTEGERGIWVDKRPDFKDPHPGELFFYDIEYGSDGGGATGPVWLTDTLPTGTEFVGWEEEYGWAALWSEVITTGGQFVLHAPAGIPGDMGGRIRLALRLDPGVEISTTLVNRVEVSTPDDVNPDNNYDVDSEAHVSPARHDLRLEKSFNNGILVPGGEVWYHIHAENRGNVTTRAWISDALPTGTSYQPGSAGTWEDGWIPLEPDEVTPESVVWDLGVLEVGESRDFDFALDIDPGAGLGDLENCATIDPEGAETTPWDNTSCVVTTLYPSGPNLQIDKSHEWYGDGRLHYELYFRNLGDEPVSNVWITDTYPVSTTFAGYFDTWEWERILTWDVIQGQRTLIWLLDQMEPGWTGSIWFEVDLEQPDARPSWYTNTVEIAIPPGDPNPADNYWEDIAFKGEVEQVELEVYGRSIWGQAAVGPITIRTAHGETVLPWSGGFDWDLDEPILPGDLITVEAGSGEWPVEILVPDPFDVEASSQTGQVWGQIDHLDGEIVEVDVQRAATLEVPTTDGAFEATFPSIPRGGLGEVRYRTEISGADVTFHRNFHSPDLLLTADYGHDWVGGEYDADHTVFVTVTDSFSQTKATAEISTPPDGGWWSTDSEDWSPTQPDIEPGDWVLGRVDDGAYTTKVQVGTINAQVHADTDLVEASIEAPWIGKRVIAGCEIHEDDAPDGITVFNVNPDGGTFECDFGGIWDILPGQNIAVYYLEPDNDKVQTHPDNPAPYLRVEKWADGEPAEGSNFVFHIQYANEGDLPAEDTTITDSLEGMTYIGDTSGLPTTGSGPGPIVWDVGTLDPTDWIQFDLFVQIAEPTSTTITNTAEIATSNPFDQGDPGEKVSTWSGHVVENQTSLNIGKGAWTGDPAPGTDLVFEVNPCNNGPTASSQLTLTDTLHPSMTLQTWWSNQPGWFEISREPQQLVVSRWSLTGWNCDSVYLRAHLDDTAEPGLYITNTASLFAANDLSPDDDVANWDAWVSEPYVNLYINKSWSSGQLVPGGQLGYDINFGNDGNLPIGETLLVTDVLPAHTTFREAWSHDNQQMDFPIEPVEITGDYVVWEVPGIENGYSAGFGVLLDVDPGAPLGVLTNTAQITCLPGEDCRDNEAHWVEELYEPGPNLRVRKWHNWNGEGQLGYQIEVENVGDEPVQQVTITDTYPVDTTFNDDWGHNFWEEPLTLTHNIDNRQLIWELVRLEPGWNTGLWFNADLDSPGELVRWYTNTVEIGPLTGDANPMDNVDKDVAFSGGEVQRVELWLEADGRTHMWGDALPGAVLTVTTPYSTIVTTVGQPECDSCWDIEYAGTLQPGDWVTVEAGKGQLPVNVTVPDPFSAELDPNTDSVRGQIGGWLNQPVEVHGNWDDGYREVETDGSGAYEAFYGRLPRAGDGYVRFVTEADWAQVIFHRAFRSLELVLTVDYRDDYVGGQYEGGHTVFITVTDSGGEPKATAEMQTPPGGGGWSTDSEAWSPQQPDIVPGDRVSGRVDDGPYTTEVRVGTINAQANVDTDVVSVTLDAPGIYEPVIAGCEIHEEDAPGGITFADVDPDGGTFECDFSDMWDIQPGQNIAVYYLEPDDDRVQNHPENPAPYLRVEKWADGEPAEGGNFVFHIQYANQGDLPAEDTTITDSLEGMTYLGDTSGLPTGGSGPGPIVWDVGTLDPTDWIQFDLFVQITEPASTTITNTAEIATSNPFDQGDPGEKVSTWSGHVVENQTSLNIGKGAWTGDPAPGTDLVFEVNPCNNGPTASSQLTLTDTLHPSMTLQTWWSNQPGWFEISSEPQQLVVSRWSLTGWSCDSVYLRAHLDETAEPGLYITNTATLFAANDLSPDDDVAYWEGSVSEPYVNLFIDKTWSWGQLVPGGQLSYDIGFGNNGNLPIGETLLVTDVLPAHTTFREAWLHGNQQVDFPIEPVAVTDEYVVWEVPGIENGYSAGFGVLLDVDPGAPLGVLTNTAQITCLPGEDCGDNEARWAEELLGPGPNLRVRKWGSWDDWGTDTRRASYGIQIENVGSARAEDVFVQDWYPPDMQMDGEIDTEWWRNLGWGDDPASHTFTVTYDYLDPGETTWINFGGIVPGEEPLDFGLILTNTVEVAGVPGEPDYEDNVDHAVLTTGPDLFVKKDLVDGELAPSALVTYILTFGNDRPGNEWWWSQTGNATLTDTLPAKTEFDSATIHWCGDTEWCEFTPNLLEGRDLVWQLGQLNSGDWNEIHLTVRVSDTIEAGEVLTNWLEIASDQPEVDVEPYRDNNEDWLEMLAVLPRFEVGKAFEGNQVAGTVVTYTLIVTNTGNGPGTHVILTDTLPGGLQYGGSDGAFLGDAVGWDLGMLAPEGGWAQAWFSGTLTCQSGESIVNDEYRVIHSDEGISGPSGAPVSFDTLAPTISVDLDYAPSHVVVSDTVFFEATVHTDGTALTYEWDLGDGTSATGLETSHIYASEGSYTVTFTATDTCDYTRVASITVDISSPDLVASFDQSATEVVVNSTVSFTDTSTTDGPPIVAWHWDFGDGSQPATTQNASHPYLDVGTFTVSLVVTDALGYSDEAVKTDLVTVLPPCTPLISADWTYEPSSPLVNKPVEFTASYLPLNATEPVTYVWNLGDGTTVTETLPTTQHTYTTSGNKTVELTLYNPCTALGVSEEKSVFVESRRVYLPLVVKNH